ncbi:MAG TPA: S8 family peptidase [Bryobacteraceae bacterium]|nr:S8 family peptidase [Bryobacteraceae bacterium]
MRKYLSLFLVAAGAFAGPAGHPKLAHEFRATALNSNGNLPVIVQWKHTPGAQHEAKIAALGGTTAGRLHSAKAGLYHLSASAVQALANDPEVAYISPDRPIHAHLDNTAGAINAAAAWGAGFTGSGIGVAVIDSGVNTDPNLGNGKAPVFSYDFTQTAAAQAAAAVLANITAPLPANSKGINGIPAPDQFGHGQHVAGIIASNGVSSSCNTCKRTFKGVAYGVNLIDLKVLDANGQGTDSNVILAIDTAIALKNVYNIRVINLSVGRPVYESYTQDPLCQAVEAAWNAGIVVVAAAGNDGRDNTYGEQGYGTINAPGNDPYVITVGAMKAEGTPTRSDDLVASYSSKGPTAVDHIVKPDLVAPGNLVVSLLANNSTLVKQNPGNAVVMSYYQNVSGNNATKVSNTYFTLSGTSMATPVVSAAVADLLQANPKLTPDQVKAILMQTAYKTFPDSSSVTDPGSGQTFVDYYDVFTVGAGYLDLGAALASVNTAVPAGTAMSPVAQMDPTTGNVSLVFDPSSIWSSRFMWGANSVFGTRFMWGASLTDTNQIIWDTRSMWGASSTSGSSAIWGSRSMWGANTTDANRSMWGASVAITGEQ